MTEHPSEEHENPVPAARPQPDGRKLWEWKSKYEDALPGIHAEAKLLGSYLGFFGLLAIIAFACVADFRYPGEAEAPVFHLQRRDVIVFLVGSLGGTIFSIKWLVHSVANGLWHEDRFLWRVFVPLTGGVYALVVLALMKSGFMGTDPASTTAAPLMRDAVVAFLAGYFADGVSGLLTNIANAIFGKVDKK